MNLDGQIIQLIFSRLSGNGTMNISKIYVAEKKLLNYKLLISQHGGSYGTAKFSVGEFFEKKNL